MVTTLSVITLVLTILFIAAEAGLGALRGMKKELCRIGSLFAIGLLLFFLVPGLAKTIILAIMQAVYPGGESLADIAGMIAIDIDMDAVAVGSVIETILALTASFLVPFVFVVLFWVCKLISWPIFALVCMIIRNARNPFPEGNVSDNTEERVENGAQEFAAASEQETVAVSEVESVNVCGVEVVKQRKPDLTERLIGTAIGLVAGLFLGALTFMPLAQLSKSVEAVGKDTIAELTDEDTADLVCFWSESPVGSLYRVTQLESLFGLLHRSLAEIEIEDRVYQAESLNELLVLVPELVELATELEDADVQSIAAVADQIKDIVESVMDISLFSDKEKMGLVRYLVREALSESAEEDELSAAMLEGIEEMSFAELKNDVLGTIDLIVVLERYGFTDTKHLNASAFSDEFIDEGAEAVYDLNIAEQLVPAAVDMILKEVLDEMDVQVVPHDKIEDFKSTKLAFKDFLKLLTELTALVEDADDLTTVSEVKTALNKVAKLKDSPFMSAQTYTNLETSLIKNTISTTKVEETIQTAVKDHIVDIKQNTTNDVDIDDEILEKLQAAVSEYLANSEEINLEDIDDVISKLEAGTLMEGIDDPEVIEDIRNDNFNLAEWLEKKK